MKTLSLSQRGQAAPASPIRKLIPFATATKEKGIKVYHLNIGDPDFALPDTIKQTFHHLANSIGRLPYPAFRGQQGLLDSWKKYFNDIQLPITFANEELIVTAGASDAMVLIAATVTDPGDEILVFEPFYAPYATYANFISVRLTAVALDKGKGYHLPAKEEIVKKITPKTKAIFFTNPNNPTGTVFNREEMRTILDIAKEHNLFVISDETYRGMAFDNKESISMFHIAKEDDLPYIVVADSLSKRLNVCGARMGLVASKNADFMAAAFRFTQGRPYAAYIEEELVHPMLMHSLDYVAWLAKEYQKRRDAFINTFEQATGISVYRPEGAFYAMIELPIDDAEHFAKWLLTDFSDNGETVMVSPGAGFYATEGKGTKEIRVAYVLNEKDLAKAAKLLAKAIKAYNKK